VAGEGGVRKVGSSETSNTVVEEVLKFDDIRV
jgi:hypothetical protein